MYLNLLHHIMFYRAQFQQYFLEEESNSGDQPLISFLF